MRVSAALIALVLALAPAAWGEELRRAQISAATADAVDGLYDELARLPVGRSLNVDQMLEQMERKPDLLKTLTQSEQIGPPRWINEQTCQVQLQISGAVVAKTLVELAAADPTRAPVTAEVLAQRVKEWEGQTFSATGSSIAPDRVEQIRPGSASEAWAAVTDEDRRRAITEARQSAVRQLMDRLTPVPAEWFAEEATLRQVFRQTPEVPQAINQWLEKRPVTILEFRDDLQVRLGISAPADELLAVLEPALERHAGTALDEEWLNRLRAEVGRHGAVAVGYGKVESRDPPAEEPVAPVPPARPAWVSQQLEVEGTAEFVESQLKTARAAEVNALAELRQKVAGLSWCNDLTVGQSAEQDAALLRGVEAALGKATITRTEYLDDQSARVYMTLNLRELWDSLRNSDNRVSRATSAPPEPAQ